jgi:hypothetical protein
MVRVPGAMGVRIGPVPCSRTNNEALKDKLGHLSNQCAMEHDKRGTMFHLKYVVTVQILWCIRKGNFIHLGVSE